MKEKPFSPMLSGKAPKALQKLKYPVMVSPKLDGFRCIMRGGQALTRTLKPIPNDYVRNWCEATLPDGFDGELMLRDLTAEFDTLSGAFRRKSGEPDFVFCAFDWVDLQYPEEPFDLRYKQLEAWFHERMEDHVMLVQHVLVNDAEELLALHEEWTMRGFEGSMIRKPNGPYKFGRSTTKEGYLLKLKNWSDEEAEIIGFEEQMKNTNKAVTDATGHTKRSSHKKGKVGKGTLGKLRCRFDDGAEFGVGTGLDDNQKQAIWDDQGSYLGRRITVKFQTPASGARPPGKAPRLPVFLRFRDDGVE